MYLQGNADCVTVAPFTIFKACCGFSHPGSSPAAVSASGSNNCRLGEPPDLFLSAVLCGAATAKCADKDARIGGRTDM